MYRSLTRPMNDEERAAVQDAVDLKAPEDGLLAITAIRERFIQNLRDKQPRNQEVLDDGHVVVHLVHAAAVTVLIPIDDEGFTYFYDVGDGQLFAYCFLQEAPGNPWPNSDFEYVHSRKHERMHQWLTCKGAELQPLYQIECNETIAGLLPRKKVFLFAGSLSTLEQDLERYAAGGSAE